MNLKRELYFFSIIILIICGAFFFYSHQVFNDICYMLNFSFMYTIRVRLSAFFNGITAKNINNIFHVLIFNFNFNYL